MSNISDHIYQALRLKIISGELSPGIQIKEKEVSKQFGVSRTPVRTAFQALIQDGLVVKGSQRGIFLAEWTMNDIQEVFRLRMLLEPHATRQAAQKANPKEIEHLKNLADEMGKIFVRQEKNSIMEIQKNNHEFHTSIIKYSRSPRLQEMIRPLVKAPMVIGAFHAYNDIDIQRSIFHHNDIVTAIAIGNSDLAEDLMRVHLHMAYTSFVKSHKGDLHAPDLHSTEVGEQAE